VAPLALQQAPLLLPDPMPLAPRKSLPDDEPMLLVLVPIVDKEQPAISTQYISSRQSSAVDSLKGPNEGAGVQRVANSTAGKLPEPNSAMSSSPLPKVLASEPSERNPATPRLIAQAPAAKLAPSSISDSTPSALPATAGATIAMNGPAERRVRARVPVLGPAALAGVHTRVLLDETGTAPSRTFSPAKPAITASTPVFKKHCPPTASPIETAAITTTTTHSLQPTRGDQTARCEQPDPMPRVLIADNVEPSATQTTGLSKGDVYVLPQPTQASTTGLPLAKLVPVPASTPSARPQSSAGMQRMIQPGIGNTGARPLAVPHPTLTNPKTAMTVPVLTRADMKRSSVNEQPDIAGAGAPAKSTPLTGGSPARGAAPVTVASTVPMPSGVGNLKVKEMRSPQPASIQPMPNVTGNPRIDTTRQQVHEQPVVLVAGGAPGKVTPQAGSMRVAATTGIPAKATPPLTSAHAVLVAKALPAVLPASSSVINLEGPYVVQKEQTLRQIALVYSTSPETLSKMNPGISPDRPLPRGTHLVVPKSEARIYLDNMPMIGAPDPYIEQGISMVPFRKLVESKGGSVEWVAKVRAVNAWADNTYIGVKIGVSEARINSEVYHLAVAPSIRKSRTMVPIRFLMAALKMRLEYNPVSGTYSLISQSGKF
jgi:LysM repeat protein